MMIVRGTHEPVELRRIQSLVPVVPPALNACRVKLHELLIGVPFAIGSLSALLRIPFAIENLSALLRIAAYRLFNSGESGVILD